jgi:hypothetical protein
MRSLRLLQCLSRILATVLVVVAPVAYAGDIPPRFYQPVIYQVSLQGDHGEFAAAENDGKLHVNRPAAFRNEIFTLTDLNGGVMFSGDEVSLKSWQGWYLSARYDMGNLVLAGAQWGLGGWERFRIHKIIPESGYLIVNGVSLFTGGRIVLRASSGAWLSARYDCTLGHGRALAS